MSLEDNLDNKPLKLQIISIIEKMQRLPEVKNVKFAIVNDQDIDINIEITDECNSTAMLIKLEREVYINNISKLSGIKSIKNGVSLLDSEQNTYKIRIK